MTQDRARIVSWPLLPLDQGVWATLDHKGGPVTPCQADTTVPRYKYKAGPWSGAPRCLCLGKREASAASAGHWPLPAPLQVDAAGFGPWPRLLSAESLDLEHLSSLWLERQSLQRPRGGHLKGTADWALLQQGLAELRVGTQPCCDLAGGQTALTSQAPCWGGGHRSQASPWQPQPAAPCCSWPLGRVAVGHTQTTRRHSPHIPFLSTCYIQGRFYWH